MERRLGASCEGNAGAPVLKMRDVEDVLCPQGRVGVKICGVTNPEDAGTAVDAGADAIGINLYPGSKRFVELDAVSDWVAGIAAARVAVVVNADALLLDRITRAGCFDAVQFHGDETPEFCATSELPWIRAVRVSGTEALDSALSYATNLLLLDGASDAGFGGTGVRVDLRIAAEFVRANEQRRIILAGGLKPGTVSGAVRAVHPRAVDVASGVEMDGNPRRKDPGKVRAFIEAAKSV